MIYVEGYGYIEEALYNRIYTEGYGAGIDAENRDYDVVAFGAIRRAAEYARYNEQRAAAWHGNGVQDLADNAAFSADAIRRAIRAAIRSPKA